VLLANLLPGPQRTSIRAAGVRIIIIIIIAVVRPEGIAH
jgi:hypothetical protein